MLLGIDPGVRKLWYALIENDLTIIESGILLQNKKWVTREDQFMRMEKIFDFFVKLLDTYDITSVAMEKLYFTDRNQSNAEFVYGIRWALWMLFSQQDIPLYEYTPNELKKWVTGNGRASKLLVQKTIQKIYYLEEMPQYDDAADALGLAWILTKIERWKH